MSKKSKGGPFGIYKPGVEIVDSGDLGGRLLKRSLFL
jgi:hypothetical protein